MGPAVDRIQTLTSNTAIPLVNEIVAESDLPAGAPSTETPVGTYSSAAKWLNDLRRPRVFEPGQYESLQKNNPDLLKQIASGAASIPSVPFGCSAPTLALEEPPPAVQTPLASYECEVPPRHIPGFKTNEWANGLCYRLEGFETPQKMITADLSRSPADVSEISDLRNPAISIDGKPANLVFLGKKMERIDEDHFITIYHAQESSENLTETGLLLYNQSTREYRKFPYPELDLSGLQIFDENAKRVLRATPKAPDLVENRWVLDSSTGDIYVAASNYETMTLVNEAGESHYFNIDAPGFVLHYRLNASEGAPTPELVRFAMTTGIVAKHLLLVGQGLDRALVLSRTGDSVQFDLFDRNLNPIRSKAVFGETATDIGKQALLAASADGLNAVVIHPGSPEDPLKKTCVSTLDPQLLNSPIRSTLCLSELRSTAEGQNTVYIGAVPEETPAKLLPFVIDQAFFDDNNFLRLVRGAFGTVYTLDAPNGIYDHVRSHDVFVDPECGDSIDAGLATIHACPWPEKVSAFANQGRLLGFTRSSLGILR